MVSRKRFYRIISSAVCLGLRFYTVPTCLRSFQFCLYQGLRRVVHDKVSSFYLSQVFTSQSPLFNRILHGRCTLMILHHFKDRLHLNIIQTHFYGLIIWGLICTIMFSLHVTVIIVFGVILEFRSIYISNCRIAKDRKSLVLFTNPSNSPRNLLLSLPLAVLYDRKMLHSSHDGLIVFLCLNYTQ